eukprot:TRINITY_DN126287_c0_g1_i1.p2 TRINITY_DN126287_c0_g1~~TRINITY_DN126287_c0_g1_i1.p2  ORF type:complete len:155 (+),score=69.67 TRINITY_DN126287_c0_g1_i1:102-566(+)
MRTVFALGAVALALLGANAEVDMASPAGKAKAMEEMMAATRLDMQAAAKKPSSVATTKPAAGKRVIEKIDEAGAPKPAALVASSLTESAQDDASFDQELLGLADRLEKRGQQEAKPHKKASLAVKAVESKNLRAARWFKTHGMEKFGKQLGVVL